MGASDGWEGQGRGNPRGFGGGGLTSRCRKLTEARQLPRALPSLGAAQGTAKMNTNGASQPCRGCSHPHAPLQDRLSRSFHPHLTDGATVAQGEKRPRQGHAAHPGKGSTRTARFLRARAFALPRCLLKWGAERPVLTSHSLLPSLHFFGCSALHPTLLVSPPLFVCPLFWPLQTLLPSADSRSPHPAASQT